MEKNIFTTFETAGLCGVANSTVINWVNEGKLPAYLTPGGHRRIKREDLVLFLEKFNMPVPAELGEKKKKLLIVDDDKLFIRWLTAGIKKKDPDLEIRSVNSGFDAGKEIISFMPDLVLLDIVLPGLDGFEVLRNIRKDERTRNIKVAAVTAYDRPGVKKRILSDGADEYLVKPIRPEAIIALYEKWESHSRGSRNLL